MRPDKLWRMETPEWKPPLLEFWIERHGSCVMGSTRAELQKWSKDLDQLTASITGSRRRQLKSAARRAWVCTANRARGWRPFLPCGSMPAGPRQDPG